METPKIVRNTLGQRSLSFTFNLTHLVNNNITIRDQRVDPDNNLIVCKVVKIYLYTILTLLL